MVSSKELTFFARSAAIDAIRLYFAPVSRLINLGWPNAGTPGKPAREPMRVFISHTYGDAELRHAIEHWLHDVMNMETFSFDDSPASGRSSIERLETVLDRSDYAIFFIGGGLSVGDDWAHANRNNVVLELGLAMAKLGAKRISVVAAAGNYDMRDCLEDLRLIPGSANLREIQGILQRALREAQEAE